MAQDGGPQDAALPVGVDLHEAPALPLHDRAVQVGEVVAVRVGPDLVGLRLVDADVGHLRIRVGDPGDGRVVDLRGEGEEGVAEGGLRHVVGNVGELEAPGDVPGRPDAGRRGPEGVVHPDGGPVGLHARLLQGQPPGGGPSAGGDEDPVADDPGSVVAHDRHGARSFTLHRLGPHARPDPDPLVLEQGPEGPGHVGILGREDLGGHLQDRDLGAQPGVDLGELHADGAGAEDHDPPGELVLVEGRGVGQVVHLVETRDRRHRRHGARGHHDPVRADPTHALHLQGAGSGEAGGAEVDVHPHLPEALRVVVVGDRLPGAAHPLHDVAEGVPGRRTLEAQLVGVAHGVGQSGRGEERLGRDAPGPEAVPAQGLLLDQGGAGPQVGGSRSRDQPRGAAAHGDDVVFVFLHLDGCPGSVRVRRPATGSGRAPAASRARTHRPPAGFHRPDPGGGGPISPSPSAYNRWHPGPTRAFLRPRSPNTLNRNRAPGCASEGEYSVARRGLSLSLRVWYTSSPSGGESVL